ncbi:MAG: CARDB domain-containing protein [Parvularculaceae bacterium]
MFTLRIGVLGFFALAVAACSTPDLVVSDLTLDPSQIAPGENVNVSMTVKNVGGRAAAIGEAGAANIIALYKDGETTPSADFGEWPLEPDSSLGPGNTVSTKITATAPSHLPVGAYQVCGFADIDDQVEEDDEDNNTLCVDLAISGGSSILADLIVTKVKFLRVEQASAKVSVTVKNIGLADAAPFRVMAFDRAPRRPLVFLKCPLTDAMRATGTIPGCEAIETTGPMAPGEEQSFVGYVTFLYGDAQIPVTPVGPVEGPKFQSRTINIMADGCFHPTDDAGLPTWCRVDEIDEINNFAALTVKTRR